MALAIVLAGLDARVAAAKGPNFVASLVHIALYCCEPGADNASECLPIEAVSVYEECLVGAIRAVGKNR